MRVSWGHLCAGVCLFALILSSTAAAQVSSADRRCIDTINKHARSVARAEAKAIEKCLKDFARGVVASPEDCLTADDTGRVLKAVLKAVKSSNKACPVAPPFGPDDIDVAVVAAIQNEVDLIHGIIGSDLDLDLSADRDISRCQQRITKVVQKCEDTRLKEFLVCKRKGTRLGTISDAASLQDECLGVGAADQPDLKGKIAKTCTDKIAREIERRCFDEGLLLDQVFPACGTSDPNDLLACHERRIRCQVCNLANTVDNLSRECDLFDDGDDQNASCLPGPVCGDGLLEGIESCDDGGNLDGDGCTAQCEIEPGFECVGGGPASCTAICGDSQILGNESCDDGGTADGDGCDASCQIEAGYQCSGAPSSCSTVCGDGQVVGGETCDDGGTAGGDGCSATCQIESGYSCVGEPSTCDPVCGDGQVVGGETCDDDGTAGGDGCSATCQIETGYSCVGEPSTCDPVCGDGQVVGGETCDDGGTAGGDGCSATCQIEAGYDCTGGGPGSCSPVCGDGQIIGSETCDDGGTTAGDGCSDVCQLEPGFDCSGEPTVCSPICGDGSVVSGETCDDGGTTPGDGCSAICQIESGYACNGEPSSCAPVCGDGQIVGGEGCDDGGTVDGDGCSAVCQVEPGFVCSGAPSLCNIFEIFIDSPAHGIFTQAVSVPITGRITELLPASAAVTINGTPVAVLPDRTFSTSLTLDFAEVFNPVRATVTDLSNGSTAHDRIVVIAGDSVADGAYSMESIGLRLNDSGLDVVEPLVASLAGAGLDLATLVPVGTVLINNECFIDSIFGCLGRATVSVVNPPPSISGFGLTMDSMTNFVDGLITVTDIDVNVFLDGTGLVPNCDININANAAFFDGDYALQPDAIDPTTIDVNQIGNLGVSFTGFNTSFGGICDAPIIGDIIQAFIPDVESLTVDAMRDFLKDPDGAGPQDGPIADGIETALAGISITGPIGNELGVMLDTPLFDVIEDVNGITLGTDALFSVEIGGGPGQCQPPIGAPDLSASYAVNESFPPFGPTTPVAGVPYGLGLCISTDGFNQLLRSQTECGLLVTSITELDIGGGPVPLTAGLLSFLIPEYLVFPPATPMRIDIMPTLAPLITGNSGPGGEIAELKIAQVIADVVVDDGSELLTLSGTFDADIGLELDFSPAGDSIDFILTEPSASDLTVAILFNPLGANETQLEQNALPPLVAVLLPDLASSLASFPLPEFLGLNLDGVEVSRNGDFMSLFADLSPAP